MIKNKRDRNWRRKQSVRIEKKAFKIMFRGFVLLNKTSSLDRETLSFFKKEVKLNKNNLTWCSCDLCKNVKTLKPANVFFFEDLIDINYFLKTH